ncbi:hypothetical protein [Plantactinospora sp. GCM10030261]|uniref:hypothetical protein n=1 Tax=Plantactinospora sp. GCM10030261 TaxID=3273420 RepID=UPI003619E472
MNLLRTTWARLGALATAVFVAVLIPSAAWAASDTGSMVIEAARRRRGTGFGLIGLLCCLVVVGGIVLAVLLIMRGRRGGRR